MSVHKTRYFLIVMIVIFAFPYVNVTQAQAVTFTESSTHHKPIIWFQLSIADQLYYSGAYHSTTPREESIYYDARDPPNEGPTCHWTAEATRITVSFPNTPDPSVLNYLNGDNWLAAGMFVHSCENGSVPEHYDHSDWAYYTCVVLDNEGNLWLDVGVYFADEAPPELCLDKFTRTWLIGGVDRSTPITLTAAWNSSGFIYWTSMVNGVTYRPVGAEFNMRVEEPTAMRAFYVGWQNIFYENPTAECCYYFQFGIMSLNPLMRGGWNALVEYPQWYQDGQWHVVQKAQTTDGDHAYYDVTWRWGGALGAVEVECHNNEPTMGRYRLRFFYSSDPMVENYCLWSHEPFTPAAPIGLIDCLVGSTYEYTVVTSDPEGSDVLYQIDYGDGIIETAWDWHSSGISHPFYHTWNYVYTWNVVVRAKDVDGVWSDWSPCLPVTVRTSDNPGGGGGCPYVSTWNGSNYLQDNNLIPAAEYSNGTDITDYYLLQQPIARINGKYQSLIWDIDKHSFLDHAQLVAVDHESDVKIAVSPDGQILTYKNPTPPTTAISKNGSNILALLSQKNDAYYQGYQDDFIELDFTGADIRNGAKLVVTSDWCMNPPCDIMKSPTYIQVLNSTGNWHTVATIYPRIFWSTDIIDLSEHLPDVNGELRVRISFTSKDKIDYVGLDATRQGEFELSYARLVTANHTRLGDVKLLLQNSDNTYVELLPGEQFTLQFTMPQNSEEKRDFIIVIEGHYLFS